MRIYLLILFVLTCLASTGQNRDSKRYPYNRDSIVKYRTQLVNATTDKQRLNAIEWLSLYYGNSPDPEKLDSAILFGNILLREIPQEKWRKRAYTYKRIAGFYVGKKELANSIHASETALEIYMEGDDDTLKMDQSFALGNVYNHLGQLDKSITYLLAALKYAEQMQYTEYLIRISTAIADCYRIMEVYPKAIEYAEYSLNEAKKAGADQRTGYAYYSLASIQHGQKAYREAIETMKIGEDYFRKAGDEHGIALSQNLQGTSYSELGEYNKALFGLKKARSMWIKETTFEPYIASVDEVLGLTYYHLGQDEKAIKIIENAIRICSDKKYYQQLTNSYHTLYLLRKRRKEYDQALEAYVNYSAFNDSVLQLNNRTALERLEFQHADDKKQLVIDRLESEKELQLQEKELQDQQIERQRWQNIALFGCLGLAVVLVIIALVGYNNKRKSVVLINEQKQAAEEQKEVANEQRLIAEVKNKEILDSIAYAKRLQDAVIPPAAQFIQNFKEGFVLFMPKDIVSGDFYWMSNVGNTVYFACVDCTGHGVPGAMVSMVGNNSLNRCVTEFGLTKPSEILDRLSDLVEETFKDSASNVKDGMDIALCKYDRDTNKLEYAGANNPLWIIRSNGKEIEETKADKQPIGWFFEKQPFVNHEVALNPGDSIFLFSDGYADQFGGPKGKKFKYKQLRELLVEYKDQSLGTLESILHEKFEEWRGELDQIDDVCVLGARV